MAGDLLDVTAADELAEQIRAVRTYPVREVYAIISAGRPTEVGLRGYPAEQTVIAAGADDQLGEAVLDILYGDAVLGLDQVRRQT